MTANPSRSVVEGEPAAEADDAQEPTASASPGWMTTLYRHSRFPVPSSRGASRG